MALAQNTPPSTQYIGEFAAGFRVYQFTLESYTVDVVYIGGQLETGILVRILSSPENTIVPSGYVFLYPDKEARSSKTSSYIAWKINGITIYFVPTHENGCQVWVGM